MEKMLQLKIISPEKTVFTGEVNRVVVPGTLGPFEILINHAPIISALEPGIVIYVFPNGEEKTLNIQGGFVEVQKNHVNLCIEL